MQISIESTGPLERQMTVKIPAERINSEVSSRLSRLSKTARIDGFRKGKVPLKVVERFYGGQVRQEVLGEVVRKSFYEAVSDEKLRVAADPEIEPIDTPEDQGFTYRATFEVYPEIQLTPIESLRVVQPACEITDVDVSQMIEKLRQHAKHYHAKSEPAQNGDRITIDFTGTLDGKLFEGGEAKDVSLVLGDSRFVPGFEAALVGGEPGDELNFDIDFPEDYREPSLASKRVHFQVSVKYVSYPHLPDLDEEFFKRFGVTEGGLDAFKAQVRRNIERERDQKIESITKSEVISALLEANKIEFPKALVEREARRLLEESKEQFASHTGRIDHLIDLKPTMFEPEAMRRVGAGLIMSEIVKSAGLKADPTQVRAAIEGLASTYEEPARVIRWYYEDRSRLSEVESLILENQTVNWVLERAKVETRSTSFDALMNPVQTENHAKG